MTDIYYHPADYGLEILWTAEDDEPYAFDIIAAWGSRLSGAVYLGRDSGCSCPSPFQDFTEPDCVNRLTRVDPERGRDEVRAAILAIMRSDYEWRREYVYDEDARGASAAEQERYASDGADRILDWARGRRLEAAR